MAIIKIKKKRGGYYECGTFIKETPNESVGIYLKLTLGKQ